MQIVISMVRGVNLAAHNRVKMDALRALYESLKLRDPQTYIQSGNVVFRTEEKDLAQLAVRIEKGIERKFGFRSDVIVRTPAELRDVIARNPFAKRSGIEPSKLLVTFLPKEPEREIQTAVRRINADPEEMHLSDRELYVYYPNGMGKSKLAAVVDKVLQK